MSRTIRQIAFGAAGCAITVYVLYKKYRRFKERLISDVLIQMIDDEDEWDYRKDTLIDRIDRAKVIAIDFLWVEDPQIEHKISLICVAYRNEGFNFIVRLCRFATFPEGLQSLLEDPTIIKIGFDIAHKKEKLFKDFNIQMNGSLDIRHMATNTPARRLLSIRDFDTLESLYTGVTRTTFVMDEEPECNWEADDLTDDQIFYAGMHAHFIYELVLRISSTHGWTNYLVSSILPFSMWLDHYLAIEFQRYFGAPFHIPEIPYVTEDSPNRPVKINRTGSGGQLKALRAYKPRRTPLYDDSMLLCPDGEVLCACDKRRAQWYLDNDLADMVTESPLTVRLKFEPAQRAMLDAKYYTLPKENICVVCGTSEELIKKYVVPKEYRRHFPKLMKHHCAHDVVLTCISCHSKSCTLDEELKLQMAELCDAPLWTSSGKYSHDIRLKAVHSAGNALKDRRKRQKLPAARREELEQILKDFFDVQEVTDLHIHEASKVDYKEVNKAYVSHGEKVVQEFAKRGELLLLEYMWRTYFVASMKPAHLPKMWSESHHQDVVSVKLSFLARENPEEAEKIMKMLGLTESSMAEVFERLEDQDKVKVDKMSLNKGRLLENVEPEG